MQERMIQLMLTNGPDAKIEIATPDQQPKDQGSINLSDERFQEALEPAIERASLIIVDNISTLVRGGKENESESWQPVQDWGLKLRARGKSVLFIHHSNKDGKQRGTSRREDVLDTVIGLRHPGTYDPEQGAVFEVHFEKSRGFSGDAARPFEARLETDEHSGLFWTHRSIEDSTYDQVCRLANEGFTQKEICQELGIHKSGVSRHIKRGKTETKILPSDGVVV
jgi:putative DNA primase/helicase